MNPDQQSKQKIRANMANGEHVENGEQIQLPLSWIRTDVCTPQLNMVQLPLSGRKWIPSAEIPWGCNFKEIYHRRLKRLSTGFLLQFCGPGLSRYLMQAGGEAVQIGLEAILNVQSAPPFRASVQALAQRGQRWGEIFEIAATTENRHKLGRLVAATPYANRPQLSRAFRTGLDGHSRCFVFVSYKGGWLGAITLSTISHSTLHTELLVRHRHAPVGVMEALVTTIHQILQAEGRQQWSLGGVPFAVQADVPSGRLAPAFTATQSAKTVLLTALGRGMRFAYNYRGLLDFKKKFSPCWQPIYLCGYPTLPWRALVDLAVKLRYAQLVGYQIASLLPGTDNIKRLVSSK